MVISIPLKTFKSVMLVSVLLTITATQANAQNKGVNACRVLDNDIARLACYDTLFAPAVAKPPVSEVPVDTRVVNVPSNLIKSSAAAAILSPTSIANTPVVPDMMDTAVARDLLTKPPVAKFSQLIPAQAPPPEVVAVTAESLLSVPSLTIAPKTATKVTTAAEQPVTNVTQSAEASFGAEQLVNKDPTKGVSAIQGTVVNITKSLRGLRTFVLDNGQHWRESESNRLSIKDGQLVTLKKGALSAYYLSKADSGRTMRVKRVK